MPSLFSPPSLPCLWFFFFGFRGSCERVRPKQSFFFHCQTAIRTNLFANTHFALICFGSSPRCVLLFLFSFLHFLWQPCSVLGLTKHLLVACLLPLYRTLFFGSFVLGKVFAIGVRWKLFTSQLWQSHSVESLHFVFAANCHPLLLLICSTSCCCCFSCYCFSCYCFFFLRWTLCQSLLLCSALRTSLSRLPLLQLLSLFIESSARLTSRIHVRGTVTLCTAASCCRHRWLAL